MKKGRLVITWVVALLAVTSLATTLLGMPVPRTINYQGYLTNDAGTPVTTAVNLTFSLYAGSAGGSALWSETHNGVVPVNGLYAVQLGAVKALNLAFDQQYWLGVRVGGDPELTPRQPLNSVPYSRGIYLPYGATAFSNISSAFKVSNSGTRPAVEGAGGSGYGVRGSSTSSYGIYGTSSSSVGVVGSSTSNTGVWGVSTGYRGVDGLSTSGIGVIGRSTSSYGVRGTSSSSVGVAGYSTSNTGVWGESAGYRGVDGLSTSGIGVIGRSTSGYGVRGTSSSSVGVAGYSTSNTGVWGESAGFRGVDGLSTSGIGVIGRSTSGYGVRGTSSSSVGVAGYSTSNTGVWGESAAFRGVDGLSTSGIGVYGRSTSGNGVRGTSTSAYGMYGISSSNVGVVGTSTSDTGVWGISNSATAGVGVDGLSDSSGGIGVKGRSTSGTGVLGWTSTGRAGWFQGKVQVDGNLHATRIYITSDERFKKNIEPLLGALDKTSLLQGVSYNWRAEEYPERRFDNRRQLGLIAQEVEKVVPEVVATSTEDGYKSIEYQNLVPLLIEAVKELKARNEELARRLEALEQVCR